MSNSDSQNSQMQQQNEIIILPNGCKVEVLGSIEKYNSSNKEEIIKSQFEILKKIKEHPGCLVFYNTFVKAISRSDFDFAESLHLSLLKAFPPMTFQSHNELQKEQKKYLESYSGYGVALFLGYIDKIYPAVLENAKEELDNNINALGNRPEIMKEYLKIFLNLDLSFKDAENFFKGLTRTFLGQTFFTPMIRMAKIEYYYNHHADKKCPKEIMEILNEVHFLLYQRNLLGLFSVDFVFNEANKPENGGKHIFIICDYEGKKVVESVMKEHLKYHNSNSHNVDNNTIKNTLKSRKNEEISFINDCKVEVLGVLAGNMETELEEMAKSQFEILKKLKENPNSLVFIDGTTESQLKGFVPPTSLEMEEKGFPLLYPNGMLDNYNDLKREQKLYILADGWLKIASFLGYVNKFYPTILDDYDNKIRNDFESVGESPEIIKEFMRINFNREVEDIESTKNGLQLLSKVESGPNMFDPISRVASVRRYHITYETCPKGVQEKLEEAESLLIKLDSFSKELLLMEANKQENRGKKIFIICDDSCCEKIEKILKEMK